MKIKTFFPALLLVLILPVANASVVPGTLLGVFSGNDSSAGIMANLGLTVDFLAKIDTPSSIQVPSLSDDAFTITDFVLNGDNEATSGSWSYGGTGIATLIVLKAGPQYAVYLYNDAITGGMPNVGLWDTSDLDNKGLSHITAYSVVPVPGAIWLLASGLFGLGALRRSV